MSSRQSRASKSSKRSLAISTGGSFSGATVSTARSSSADHQSPKATGHGDRGPLSGVLSDDDARGRGGTGGSLDDGSVISFSFRSTQSSALAAPLSSSSNTEGAVADDFGGETIDTVSSIGGAAVDPSDPRLHLAPLNDERSGFGAVFRSCLTLNQWAGCGSGGTIDDGDMDLLGGNIDNDGASRETFSTSRSSRPTVCSSHIYCPSQHDTVALPILRALMTCSTSHADRRCRILSLQTLARVGRAVYARTRESEMGLETFTRRDGGASARIEDEVVNDVATTLLTVGLEEDDDGISSVAFEAVGMLILSSTSVTPGPTALEGKFDGGYDALSAEISSILTSDPSWRGSGDPSWINGAASSAERMLAALSASPSGMIMHELASRVYASIVPPRIRKILHRISLYRPTPSFSATSGTSNTERTLPFVVGALTYMLKVERCTSLGLDKAGYAKRWTELDARGMITETVRGIILPVMTDGSSYGIDGTAAVAGSGKAAVLAALRLAHACPDADWTVDVCDSVVAIMTDYMRCAAAGGHLLDPSIFAITMIALRGVNLADRSQPLSFTIDAAVKMLPATEVAPAVIGSAGLPVSGDLVRRPARLGVLIEAALLVLMPSPADGDGETDESLGSRSELVFRVFGSSIIRSILKSRSNKKVRSKKGKENINGQRNLSSATSVADEIVLIFCSVASLVGRTVLDQFYQDGTSSTKIPSKMSARSMESWLRAAVALLYELSSCITWNTPFSKATKDSKRKGSKEDNGHDESSVAPTHDCMTVAKAARGAYLKLLSQCLAATDLIDAASSVTTNLTCFAANGHLEEGFGTLAASAPLRDDTFSLGMLSELMDWITETKLREGIPCQSVRICLLALLSDYWVQVCRLTLQSKEEMDGLAKAVGLNEMNAREILSLLASEISLLIEHQERSAAPSRPVDSALSKAAFHNLFICVACVENMAIAVNDWTRHFGDQNDEDLPYLISVATAILNGQGRNNDQTEFASEFSADPRSPHNIRRDMIEECSHAALRVQAIVAENGHHYTNGGGQNIRVFSANASPLIERERLSYLPERNDDEARPTCLSSTTSIILDSGGYSPALFTDNDTIESTQHNTIDALGLGYIYQHHRQAILYRAEYAIQAAQVHRPLGFGVGGFIRPLRPLENLRLSLPPPTIAIHQQHTKSLLKASEPRWTQSMTVVTGSSDPVSIRIHFFDRVRPRNDGETERRLVILLKMHNLTPVPIPGGVRLNVSLETQEDVENNVAPIPFAATAFHGQEIKAGDHIAWTLETNGWITGPTMLQAAVSFHNLEAEATTVRLIKEILPSAKASLPDSPEGQENNEDDFSVGQGSSNGFLEPELGDDGNETTDVTLICEPLELPSSIVLQPCPLVFFRNADGDQASFHFLWSSVPHRMTPFQVVSNSKSNNIEDDSLVTAGCAAREIARLSKVASLGENSSIEAWAFSSWNSRRILCLLTRDNSGTQGKMHVRSDDRALLNSLLNSPISRSTFVSDLTSGHLVCLE